MYIVFALASAFFGGLVAILAKLGVKDINSNFATFIRTFVVLAFSWIIVFIFSDIGEIKYFTGLNWLFLALSGICTGASWLCYFKALQLGNVNKVAPVDNSSVVLTVLVSFLFLGETVTVFKVIGIIGIIAGTFLMIEKKDLKPSDLEKKQNFTWFIFAVCSAVFAALVAIFAKIGLDGVDSNLATALRTIIVLVFAFFILLFTKDKNIKSIFKRNWIFLVLSGVATGISWLFYFSALKIGEVSVVAAAGKLSIIVVIIFSYFILKEKLTKKSFIGFLLLVIFTFVMLLDYFITI